MVFSTLSTVVGAVLLVVAPPTTVELLKRAKRYERSGDVERALIAYERVLEMEPVNPTAVSRLGLLYFAKGLHTRARDRYEQIVKIAPKRSDAWYILGFAYRKSAQCGLAIPAFLKYISLVPEDADPLYSLAACYEIEGELKRAKAVYLEYIRRAKRRDRAWVVKAQKALVRLATLLGPRGKRGRGGKKYAAFIYSRAVELYRKGEKGSALSLVLRGLSADPSHLQLLQGLSSLALELSRCKSALPSIKKGLDFHPRSKTLLYSLAWCQRNDGHYIRAATTYKTYLASYPHDTEVIYGLAETYRLSGRLLDAKALYERYVGLERRSSQASWIRHAKEHIAAITATLRAKRPPTPERTTPRPGGGLPFLSIKRLIAEHQFAAAARAITSILGRGQKAPILFAFHAEIYAALGLYTKAVALADRAIRMDSGLATPYRVKGVVAVKKRMRVEALSQFKRFLALAPSDGYERENINKIKMIYKNLSGG